MKNDLLMLTALFPETIMEQKKPQNPTHKPNFLGQLANPRKLILWELTKEGEVKPADFYTEPALEIRDMANLRHKKLIHINGSKYVLALNKENAIRKFKKA